MTVSKEQWQALAQMADMNMTKNVLQVGREVWEFDKEGNRLIRRSTSVDVVTVLKNQAASITVDSTPDGQQVVHIRSRDRRYGETNLASYYITLADPEVTFLHGELQPNGIIFVDINNRLVELDKEANITRIEPEAPR